MYTGALENHPELVDQWPGSRRCGATRATCSRASARRGSWPKRCRTPACCFRKRARRPTACRTMALAREDVPRRQRQRRAGVGRGAGEQGAVSKNRRCRLSAWLNPSASNGASPACPAPPSSSRRMTRRHCSASRGNSSANPGSARTVFNMPVRSARCPYREATCETIARIGNVLTQQFELRGPVRRRLHSRRRASVDARSQSAIHGVGGNRGTCHRSSRAIALHAAACVEGLEVGTWNAERNQPPAASPQLPLLRQSNSVREARHRDFDSVRRDGARRGVRRRLGRRWPTFRPPARQSKPAGRSSRSLPTAQTVDDVEQPTCEFACEELERQLYRKRGAAMRLGIISDTHGHVELTRPAVRMFESLDVDAVLHCGDIGSMAVVELFAAWPTHFVFGNCDDGHAETSPPRFGKAGQTCHGLFGDLDVRRRADRAAAQPRPPPVSRDDRQRRLRPRLLRPHARRGHRPARRNAGR